MTGAGLTRRQYFLLCSLAVLSPLLRLVPQETAAYAGNVSWLCAAAAYGPLLLFGLLLNAMLRARRPGEGMGELILRALGPVFGRGLLAVYALCFLLYAAFLLRSGADRFLTSVSIFRSAWPYAAVLLILALFGALGGPKPLFRAAEIFYPALMALLLFALLFALPQLHVRRLFAVSAADAAPVLRGAVPLLNIGCGMLFYPTFFEGRVSALEGRGGAVAGWLARLCLLAAVLNAVAVSMLGASLTAHLSYPFFTMLRNVSIFHAVERFEALIVGMWVLPDFALLALMLLLASGAARTVLGCPPKNDGGGRLFRLENGRIVIWICAAAVFVLAQLLTPNAFTLREWSCRIIPAATLILTAGCVPVIFLIGKLRKTL